MEKKCSSPQLNTTLPHLMVCCCAKMEDACAEVDLVDNTIHLLQFKKEIHVTTIICNILQVYNTMIGDKNNNNYYGLAVAYYQATPD